jgi:hypothetical protein
MHTLLLLQLLGLQESCQVRLLNGACRTKAATGTADAARAAEQRCLAFKANAACCAGCAPTKQQLLLLLWQQGAASCACRAVCGKHVEAAGVAAAAK